MNEGRGKEERQGWRVFSLLLRSIGRNEKLALIRGTTVAIPNETRDTETTAPMTSPVLRVKIDSSYGRAQVRYKTLVFCLILQDAS